MTVKQQCGVDAAAACAADAVMLIYKVLRPAEWADMQAKGQTAGAPVDLADGFVHFSTAAQLPGTLDKHFAGAGDLILLACDAGMTGIRWEKSRGGQDFPHLYRALRMEDVIWSRPLADGERPEGLE